MSDNVILSIKGTQRYEGEEDSDVVELVTLGTLQRDEDGLTISYEETELTGMEGTTTKVRIEDGPRVTLLREGRINTQMIFQMGQRYLALYETPYGALSVGIQTQRLKNTVNENGGDLEIDYNVEVNNLQSGKNLFRLNVKRNPADPQKPRIIS